MTRPLRRAGAAWRLLVHHHPTDGPKSDMARSVQSDQLPARDDGEYSQTTVLPRTEFDELVVGRAIHIESMDTGLYWMNIGGVVIILRMDRDGRPTSITVEGPDYGGEGVDGCKYELRWDEE